MRTSLARAACVLLILLLPALAAAAVAASAAEWPIALQVMTQDEAGEARWQAVEDADGRSRVLSRKASPVILRVVPAAGEWPPGAWVLQLGISPLHWVRLDAEGRAAQPTRALNPVPGLHAGHGDLAFRFERLPAEGAPLVLQVDTQHGLASTLAVRLLPAADYDRGNAAWLAYAGAALAVMTSMAVMALLFAAYLRDSSFLWYAAYLLAYVWILGLQSAFLAAPLGLAFDPVGAPVSGRIATAAAVACAAMFLDRFGQLGRYAPLLRRGLHALAAAIVLTSLASLLPSDALMRWARALTNPLIILGGPLLLLVALYAALRGSRYALVFAVGWAPLLAVTVMGSLQLFGLFSTWRWLDHAGMAAGAFEALVLSAGLAYRSMELRRDRDSARRLADLDPLTGLLNRRAWSEQVRRRMADGCELSLLFIDLDHFKSLNDRHGHDLGDRALAEVATCLRAELRPQDLLARHGGEELVVALPDCSEERALGLAERLRGRVAGLQIPTGEPPDAPGVSLTLSIGLARQQPGESLEDLVRRADAAMYRAKRAGRDRVEVDRAAA